MRPPAARRTQCDAVLPGDVQHRRHRNRQFAVLTADESGAFGKSGHHALFHAEIVRQHRRRDDVHDRIDRADFVKVHLLHRAAVRLRLRLRDDPEDPLRQLPGAIAHLPPVDHRIHIGEIPVLVRVEVVMVPVLMLVVVVLVVVVLVIVA